MVKEKKSYNGYSSYSAWNVALWLANTENDYFHIESLKETAIKKAGEDKNKICRLLCNYVIRDYEGSITGDGVRMSKRSLREYVKKMLED